MNAAQETMERLAVAKAAVVKGLPSAPKKKRKSTWQPPEMDRFAYGTVFAFDQTATKTGYCLFTHGPGLLVVHRKGKLVEPPLPDLKGFADLIQRSVWMTERIQNVIFEAKQDHPEMAVAHEFPISQGYRVESSLVGAIAVNLACSHLCIKKPTMISKTRVASVLCPPEDRIGKPAIGRAVNRYFDTASREWNQDSRDAFAIGLTYLYELAREQTP